MCKWNAALATSPSGQPSTPANSTASDGRWRHQAEGQSVLMDLSELEFMDSSGLAIMVQAITASRNRLGLRDRL